jgi:tetratricopeptide (TPR) repeat protein
MRKICGDPVLSKLYENRLAEGKDLGKKIEQYPFEAFLELISRHYSILESIAGVFRGGSPNKNHLLIANLMQKRLVREVLTTNFDLLIEKALEGEWARGVDFEVYLTEKQFGTLASGPRLPAVFKIHGSADDVASMRVTLDLVASRALSEVRAKVLDHFLASDGDILILGYGGKDDFDINPILGRTRSKKRIFYVQHPKDENVKKTEVEPSLPDAFCNFVGSTLLSHTDEVIDYLWTNLVDEDSRKLGDQLIKQVSSLDKGWRVVIDDWTKPIAQPSRFFITALILHALEQFDESSELYRQAKEGFEKLGEEPRAAACLNQLGIIAKDRGDYPEAERLHRQCLHTADQAGVAFSLHNLGIIAQHRGDYPEAERLYRQSLQIKETLGDQAGIASDFHQLGIIAQLQGKYPEAELLCKKSLKIRETFGDERGVSDSLQQLAVIAQLRGDYPTAEGFYRQSMQIADKLVNQARVASCLHNIGIIAQHRGDLPEAEQFYKQSLEIREKLGDQAGVATSLHQLGIIRELQGDHPEAERLCKKSLEIMQRLGDQRGVSKGLFQLGLIAQHRGKYADAERFYKQSMEIAERLEDRAAVALDLHQLGIIAELREDYPAAERFYKQSLEMKQKMGDQEGVGLSLGQLGMLFEAQGQLKQAEDALSNALQMFTKIGNRPMQKKASDHLDRIREKLNARNALRR